MITQNRRGVGIGAALIAAALAITACSSSSDSAGAKGSDAAGPSASASAASPVTIKVQSWLVGDDPTTVGPTLKKIDAMFMAANPGVTIDHVGLPFDNYFTLLRGQVAAKAGPDVVMAYNSSATLEFQKGLLGLGSYYTAEDRKGLVGFQYGTDTQKIDGEPYVTPILSEGNLLYVNKKLVKQCGADPEKIPREWDGFVKVLEQCKAAGVVPMNLGMKDGYAISWYTQNATAQLLSQDELLKSADGSVPMNNPGNVWALNAIQDLQKRGLYTPGAEGITVFSEARNNFAAGKAAFHFGNLSEGGQLYKKPLGADLGVALFPKIPGDKYGDFIVAGPGVGWAVTKWAKNPDMAAKYIKFTQSQEPQQMLFDQGGELPANSATAPKSDYAPVQQTIDWLALPDNHLGMVMSTEAGAAIWKNATLLLSGDLSADDLIGQMQAAQDLVNKTKK
ncbi:ABC transporter substrate-binding protein [Nakamurella antarctica]|uniref:ABC transporter substrate-binding protein n=1 Tax=Nakamurella antarctica TaxID=1902245 RepID=UPI0013DD931E|nr:extracellular solute-binding protein [Nakamurella antarctica]